MVLLEAFAVNSVVLAIKIAIIGPITGFYRSREKIYTNAEDKKFLKISTETLSNEDSMTERMRRIHQNDLENILPWALVVCAYMFVSVKDIMNPGARLWNEIIGTVLISLFTLSRIAFMIVYWAQLQPWRTLAFFVGNMLLVTLGLYTIVMAFIPWYDMRK